MATASKIDVTQVTIDRPKQACPDIVHVGYCLRCGSCWEGKRRLVRDMDELFCELCRNREREGLVHYTPSNGAEGDLFFSQCEECRHNIDDPDNPRPGSLTPPYQTCAWGVSDRLYVQMLESRDHTCMWFDPDDIKRGCPATCRRFTPRDYSLGDRDPAPPPCPGQMSFDDLDTPVERVPVLQMKGV